MGAKDDKPDRFAELFERTRRLHEQLASAPVVDVRGVVDAHGVTGGRSRGESLWEVLFAFAAWRVGEGNLRATGMTVRQTVSREELTARQKRIKSYEVWRIRAAVVFDFPNGDAQARLVELVGPVSTDELLNLEAERLQQPVTFQDDVLGTFTLDRRVGWYSGRTVWNGREIELSLSPDKADDLSDVARTARALCDGSSAWGRRIVEFAVGQLLELKNVNWLRDDESKVSADEFAGRMTLTGITVGPGGDLDFWHDDGGLFWGHSIQVSGSLSEGPKRADIPG